jgi:WhiB family redox-sensing transcriptional regulator
MNADNVSADNQSWLAEILTRLDRLIPVPTDVLADIVMRDGACMACSGNGDTPALGGRAGPDRELAARICEGCPVQDQCLELELRWAGPYTVGVWGALSDQDRRALYPLWRERGHSSVQPDARGTTEGGEVPWQE